jgi:hypothetical protein
MEIVAVCHTCARQHKIDFDPIIGPGAAFSDWLTKHPGPVHDTDFVYPRRRQRERDQRPTGWAGYLSNEDVKVAYGATITPTLTLASLAASAALLGGRESTAIDNGATNKYLDYLIAGKYRQAATNTAAGRILTCIVGAQDDTPNWPDVFDGTDSTETVTTADIFNSICRVASDITTAATASATNPFGPVGIAGLFGGIVPDQFVIFVTHNAQTSTNAWHATEGDHAVRLTPAYATVA